MNIKISYSARDNNKTISRAFNLNEVSTISSSLIPSGGIEIERYEKKYTKANSTWCSQAVTHPSTNRAQRCLTSVIGRELVRSTWYGRRHRIHSLLGTQRKMFLLSVYLMPLIQAQQNVYNIAYSQAVTHPSTNATQCCLTSVIGRELVFSTWYGRRHMDMSILIRSSNYLI